VATSDWFPYRATGSGEVRLFCLPPAGGGASGYRHWPAAMPPGVEVLPVQPPGREARLGEPAITSAAEFVDVLAGPLLARAGERFAVFGHSMGGFLAYELAQRLTELGRPPAHLVISGHVPPHLRHLRRPVPPVAEMSEEFLRDYLADTAGTPAEILGIPELMELVLPVLRADLLLCETYRPRTRPPLDVPLSVFGGDADPDATPDLLARWAGYTTAAFTTRTFPGGHGYLHDDTATVAAAVAAAVSVPTRIALAPRAR
jgi:surfactin synthase thioesterase subunit